MTEPLAGIRVVLSRESGAYFNSSIAYVYASVFLLLAHGIFMNGFFLDSVVDMAPRLLPRRSRRRHGRSTRSTRAHNASGTGRPPRRATRSSSGG